MFRSGQVRSLELRQGCIFSKIRVQSAWKTDNDIVEVKNSLCKKYMWFFEYFYLVKYIAISFHINSCGRVFNIKMYNIEMLLQNGFEDINFIMKFWKDNSKCQNFCPFKIINNINLPQK